MTWIYPLLVGASYRQFCPVAKAMELLDERWTLLLVRELILGAEHFNDLRRGLPRMSPTLLAKRLHQLTAAGIVTRDASGGQIRYRLTRAGRELEGVVAALGLWGTRWIGDLGDADLDPKLLLWDMHRNVNHRAVPPGRVVIRFQFTGVPAKVSNWWLLIEEETAEVCDIDPGHPVDITVFARLRGLTRVWRGDLSWAEALSDGEVDLHGPPALRRALPAWFALSRFAETPRPTAPAVGRGGR